MAAQGIAWQIGVNQYLNMMHAQSTSTDPTMQSFMLDSAIDLIERAAQYGGKPCNPPPVSPSPKKFIVHFSLIFKDQAALTSFLSNLTSGN